MQVDPKDIYNIDIATRQTEINEWTYSNKMDTLFVFQLSFLSIVFVSILFYLYKIGVLGRTVVFYVTGVLMVILLILILNRYAYTSVTRDKHLWNRRNFIGDNTLKSPVGPSDSYIKEVKAAYGPATPPPSAGGAGCVCPPK